MIAFVIFFGLLMVGSMGATIYYCSDYHDQRVRLRNIKRNEELEIRRLESRRRIEAYKEL